MIRCLAFDCFGTVFDMSGISRDEIAAYVAHVRKADFTPFEFPASWWSLKAHADAAEGIKLLKTKGLLCVTLSNGDVGLLSTVALRNGIDFDWYIDLVKHRVYKPHLDAYRTVQAETNFQPNECIMVTANPTFGDVEGAAAIGMIPQVIRQPGMPQTILELAQGLGVVS